MTINRIDLKERIAISNLFTPEERTFVLVAINKMPEIEIEHVGGGPNYMGRKQMRRKQSEMEVVRAERLLAYDRWRKETQPCKNEQPQCRHDGGCLRCDADAGEACR